MHLNVAKLLILEEQFCWSALEFWLSTVTEIIVSFTQHWGAYIWIQLSTSSPMFQRDVEIPTRPCKGCPGPGALGPPGDGLVGSGCREAEEGLRAACGYRKGRYKGDGWDQTVLGEQRNRRHQPCGAPWEVEA